MASVLPFNHEDGADLSFQLETNRELSRVVAEHERSVLGPHPALDLGELLRHETSKESPKKLSKARRTPSRRPSDRFVRPDMLDLRLLVISSLSRIVPRRASRKSSSPRVASRRIDRSSMVSLMGARDSIADGAVFFDAVSVGDETDHLSQVAPLAQKAPPGVVGIEYDSDTDYDWLGGTASLPFDLPFLENKENLAFLEEVDEKRESINVVPITQAPNTDQLAPSDRLAERKVSPPGIDSRKKPQKQATHRKTSSQKSVEDLLLGPLHALRLLRLFRSALLTKLGHKPPEESRRPGLVERMASFWRRDTSKQEPASLTPTVTGSSHESKARFKLRFHRRSLSGLKIRLSTSSLSISEPVAESKTVLDGFGPEMFVNHSKILLGAAPARRLASENKMLYLDLYALMTLCQSSNNLVLELSDFVGLRMREIKTRARIGRLAAARVGEVYAERGIKTRKITNVWKVTPLGDQYLISDAIVEMTAITRLQNVMGFARLKLACVLKGEYCNELLKEWDFGHVLEDPGTRPDYYGPSQLYLVHVSSYGGTTLKDHVFQLWHQMVRFFWGLTRILKTAELLYRFEHRNLNWENVLIGGNEDDEPFRICSGTTAASSLDQTSDESVPSETYGADSRVTVVGLSSARMESGGKVTVGSAQGKRPILEEDSDYPIYDIIDGFIGEDPEAFCPKTSVAWLHYIVDKLFKKGLEVPEKPTEALDKLKRRVVNRPVSVGNKKSILRKTGETEDGLDWSGLMEDELHDVNEYRAYTALVYIHKLLDPRAGYEAKNTQPFFKSAMDDSGDVFESYKRLYFREDVDFGDFENLEQVFKWGELNELIL